MKKTLIAFGAGIAVVALASSPLAAGERGHVTGSYVEARTAEVFTGGCIMNSEAETLGREAVMAWQIDRGSYNGVSLDGLSVVAAVAGDRNLGMREMGGTVPSKVQSLVMVDARASEEQKLALVAFARELSGGLINDVVDVKSEPIRFTQNERQIGVAAGDAALLVETEVKHEMTCGAMQWFKPFSEAAGHAAIGTATSHSFMGNQLGTKWSDPNKKSAFFGTFTY
jgi:hypothetical protein